MGIILVRNFKSPRNTYCLDGEYGIGYTYKGDEWYFDLEDYDLIKNYTWHVDKTGYLVAFENRKMLFMHRIIMNCPDGMYVDHIHGKRTRNDNRKKNLRLATKSQNAMNVGLNSLNKSGVTGVFFDKSKGLWCARIEINQKMKHIGYYNTKDAAIKARKDAEIKYFGEFSYGYSQQLNTEGVIT